jgi:prevent-host-death family protein
MKHVQASAAKARFAELLDQVERGETIVITRHGKEIATLSPHDDQRRRKIAEAMAEMDAIRAQAKPVTVAEILAWRDEGRR